MMNASLGLMVLLTACGNTELESGGRALELVEDSVPAPTVTPAVVEELPESPVELAVSPTPVEGLSVEVAPDENLVLLASWAEVDVEALIAANPGLDPALPLRIGQELVLPLADGEAFTARRAEANEAKLDRYLARRGGLVGTTEHRVRRGDTAWDLATEEAGVPLWVLAALNEGVDLEGLRIGDRVLLPVLGDDLPVAVRMGPTPLDGAGQ